MDEPNALMNFLWAILLVFIVVVSLVGLYFMGMGLFRLFVPRGSRHLGV